MWVNAFAPPAQQHAVDTATTNRRKVGRGLPVHERDNGLTDRICARYRFSSIEKIFAPLARYRQSVVQTDCVYGCPIGSLALEIHEPDPPVRKALAENFNAWVDVVEQCLLEADLRLPKRPDRRELAECVLTTMEGA